jgi:hypothetical protein
VSGSDGDAVSARIVDERDAEALRASRLVAPRSQEPLESAQERERRPELRGIDRDHVVARGERA